MPRGEPNLDHGTMRRRLEDVMSRGSYCAYQWTADKLADRLSVTSSGVHKELVEMRRARLVSSEMDYETGQLSWYWIGGST